MKELKSYEEVTTLLSEAKRILPHTLIGVSVLATNIEDFRKLRNDCRDADFWELNFKYSMRTGADGNEFFARSRAKWEDTLQQLMSFLDVFDSLPVFIKLPRELEWLPGTPEASDFISKLASHGNAGVIVANSRKLDITPFIDHDEEKHFHGGVLTGDPLFDSTLTMIEGLRKDCESKQVPIVASGGMVDEQQALMAVRAGADAVQLCAAFDYNGHAFYQTLVDGLSARIKWRGLTNMSKYVTQLRSEGIASVYSMPFIYYPAFWNDSFQKQIQQDIRLSRRMDFVLMSGRTVFNAWSEQLEERVTKRLHSLRGLALNPKGIAFSAIQQTWGIAEPNEIEARRERVYEAKKWLDGLLMRGAQSLAKEVSRLNADESSRAELEGTAEAISSYISSTSPNVSELIQHIRRENETRKRKDKERWPCPTWGSMLYEKVPFYSMYIFDDKVYVSMYPFIRPGALASPVYVYYRSSIEFKRLSEEFETLWNQAAQIARGSDSASPAATAGVTALDEVE